MRLKIILAVLMLSIPIIYAASTTYYAKTTVYFNVPSDATFSIAMPSNYASWASITGTTEGGATATNWMSFNFTDAPQSALQQPYELGASANTQSGPTKPIFYIDNTGNTNEAFDIKLAGALPTGISLYHNATCGSGSCGTVTGSLTASTTSYLALATAVTTSSYLNVTLYANTTSTASAGQSSQDIYIRSTAA